MVQLRMDQAQALHRVGCVTGAFVGKMRVELIDKEGRLIDQDLLLLAGELRLLGAVQKVRDGLDLQVGAIQRVLCDSSNRSAAAVWPAPSSKTFFTSLSCRAC